jgi:cytochrome c peroxidase
MNTRIAAAVTAIVAALGGGVWAQQPSVTLSPAALKEIAEVEAEIDRIEAQALGQLTTPPDNEVQLVELLGKAMLYDKELSVSRNEACAFCHMPETASRGPYLSSTARLAPIPVQCARVSATVSRRHTPMPRSRPFCITIPARAIL